jgi:hypothetical protein
MVLILELEAVSNCHQSLLLGVIQIVEQYLIPERIILKFYDLAIELKV